MRLFALCFATTLLLIAPRDLATAQQVPTAEEYYTAGASTTCNNVSCHLPFPKPGVRTLITGAHCIFITTGSLRAIYIGHRTTPGTIGGFTRYHGLPQNAPPADVGGTNWFTFSWNVDLLIAAPWFPMIAVDVFPSSEITMECDLIGRRAID